MRSSALEAAAPEATLTEPVLKLYIDSTSLPLAHQAADLVAGIGQPGIMSLITWLRVPLSESQLRDLNACYLPQMAAVSPGFVDTVCTLVRKTGVRRVEIHSNQYHAWRGVAPLLRQLLPLLPDGVDAVRLELYDDGNMGLIQRAQLKAQPDPQRLLRLAAEDLKRAVLDGKPLRWGIAQSYAWQHLFATRYHLLRPEILLWDSAGQALHECLAPYVLPMRFDQFKQLDEKAQRRYLELFGLDSVQVARLRPLAENPDVLLFIGSSIWDKAQNAELADRQIAAVGRLRAEGLLQKYRELAFKAHPANMDHSGRLAAALGERVEVIPPRVPMEILQMAGLLPCKVAGVVSSSYFTLPEGAVEYLLCRPESDRTDIEAALIPMMLRAGVVDSTRLIPLV